LATKVTVLLFELALFKDALVGATAVFLILIFKVVAFGAATESRTNAGSRDVDTALRKE
jgi:hypothetical protein